MAVTCTINQNSNINGLGVNFTGGELRSGVKCIVVTFVTGSIWLLWRYPGEPKTNAQYVAIISRQYLCDTDKYQAIYQ